MQGKSQRNLPTKGSVKNQRQIQEDVDYHFQMKTFHEFVGKFLSQWKSGHEANLNVSCRDGSAHINFHVGLELSLPLSETKAVIHHPHLPPNLHKVSPSRIRRRQRRANAKNGTENVSSNVTLSPSISLSEHNKVLGQRKSEETAQTGAENAASNIAIDQEAGIVYPNDKFPSGVPLPQHHKDETEQEGKIAEKMTELDPGAVKVPPNVSFSPAVPSLQLKKVKREPEGPATENIAERKLNPVNYKKMFYAT